MTVFVDASALIALIAVEPEKTAIAEAIGVESDRLWSAMSCWESVRGLGNAKGMTFEEARSEIEIAAAVLSLRLVEVGEEERRIALHAYEVYGKGRHEARLNMGDCFAYACAKTNGATLLYKGGDFSKTDLA